ncbi:RcnB family protein [Novosphingobium sp.]|uniref:RcnB family protein n=1 Tax=Novosphingobium sp. TaxID=1874826 RepID=UPI0025FCA34B|nr:RcnB family protein [Novosphingobium sp.]
MRKFIAAAIAATVLVPVTASAQTAELRRDRHEVRQGQREVRQDLRRGDYREAREDRQEVREDRREYNEDWREYRSKHQSAFRKGAWSAPHGYRYSPVRVGVGLNPAFYAGRYTINDPYTYRLPRAAVGTRYVRYGNDVLLINARTGRVLRVYDRLFY